VVLGNIADKIGRVAQRSTDSISEALFEPVIRLGVTGLSRSGKTVFITNLVANLLDRGRMTQLIGARDGSILSAYLQPQPDDTLPRFEYEKHLSDMIGSKPKWPQSTRSISQLRLSFRVQGTGILSGVRGPRTVHLDIVDYPGEWLLDLPMLDQSFADWSQQSLMLAAKGTRADFSFDWMAMNPDVDAPLDELVAQKLAGTFTKYLSDCREAGFSACSPGRFLMPGDLAGSPALTFAPLTGSGGRGSLYREFERRFEAYKKKIVKPFFKNHFSHIERQIVLVDALGALHAGPQAVDDLRNAMVDILNCFKTGRNGILSGILGKSVERILFASTKADHLHHGQHGAMTSIMDALLREAKDRANFQGATTNSLSLASLRTTVEEVIKHEGETLEAVRGRLLDTGKEAVMYAGELPDDPTDLLQSAREGAQDWLADDYAIMRFSPAKITLKSGDGPPHIRLDRAAEFLFGDKLV
jgi:predicted YcjX-like family ATPase